MPKINVYLPDELAAAVRDAQVPVSAICQAALERAVRDIGAARSTDEPPAGGRVRGRLFRRFTDRARSAVSAAQREAQEHGHRYIGTEHLLLGVLDEGANLGIKVLESLEVEPADLRAELVASLLPAGGPPGEKPPFTPLAKAVLEHAASEVARASATTTSAASTCCSVSSPSKTAWPARCYDAWASSCGRRDGR